MIRTDKLHQWAETQMAPACVTDSCLQGRVPCPTPNACSYVAQPLAAHAATDIGCDTKDAGQQMGEGAGAIVVPLVFGVALLALLAAVNLIATYWPLIAVWLGL